MNHGERAKWLSGVVNLKQAPYKKINLQVALDVGETASLLGIAHEVAEHVDWFEAGTPWIMSEGMRAVRALREEFPNRIIVADLKIVDAGEFEAGIGFKAGADIVTVLGMASDATIRGAIQAANHHGGKVIVDLLQVSDIVGRLKEILELGAHYVGIHNAFDDLESGLEPTSDIAHITKIAPNAIVIGGGIDSHNIKAIGHHRPCSIIVGRSVTAASNPGAAAKEFRTILDNIQMKPSSK